MIFVLLSASFAQSDDFATTAPPQDDTFCVEPDVQPPRIDDFALPTVPMYLGDALSEDGTLLDFFPRSPSTDYVDIVLSVEEATARPIAGKTVSVVDRTTTRTTTRSTSIELLKGERDSRDLEVVVRYRIGDGRSRSTSGLAAESLTLVEREGGATVHRHVESDFDFVATPSSCEEEALVRFGPFPYGMPPVHFPDLDRCDGTKCVDVAEAWVHLHHNVWRVNQMFTVLDAMPSYTRDVFWEREGMDANGEGVTGKTAPSYWFGGYDDDRYNAVREVVHKYQTIMETAKTGSIRIKMQCPNPSDNPGNLCTTTSTLGHHSIKGWVNVCGRAWTSSGCGDDFDTVHEVVTHEPLHHVFTHMNGLRAVRDTITHGHGNFCLSGLQTRVVYCEESTSNQVGIRHFVEHGSGCWHHDKITQSADAYAKFILNIGERVLDGEMTHWPLPTPPTPMAPECVGGEGCLCEDTESWEEPDGDYLPNTFCSDNGNDLVCMTTTFNASQTVGVCTDCEATRGPGCECNDLTHPCDIGNCYGDDTNGNASATGTCYRDGEVPDFGCVADCEALLGNGAFCMTDHPDHARCVPAGSTLPEASNCWWEGGHMDPQELACTSAEQCSSHQGCHDLGYPTYFACESSRCVPAL